MGYDYALVHLKYTIPPALILSVCYYPLSTALGLYKICFLITIAVLSTTPWDSYLIRTHIWTYPANTIIGPTIFSIPAEEVFFFIIQTLITSLLYLILSKPLLHPAFLRGRQLLHDAKRMRRRRWLGTSLISATILAGIFLVRDGTDGMYLGLIFVWAGPFILLLWCLAYQFILGLPISTTLVPIMLPTAYLWIVDTIALRRGTWVIESGTKLGWQLWTGLEIEEAIFFLLTNVLIVFGLVAFDNAFAILQIFPDSFPHLGPSPNPLLLIKALLIPPSHYDESRIRGVSDALGRLRRKSRSFYLASSFFTGRLRVDLVLLYSFCRVADDLIDEATTADTAREWIGHLYKYLDISYGQKSTCKEKMDSSLRHFVTSTFPASTHSALLLLPTAALPPQPLYDLIKGFEMDLCFTNIPATFPITDEAQLSLYSARVAGTVAELCLELVFYHHQRHYSDAAESANSGQMPIDRRRAIIDAGGRMGIALQYINIARDIDVDAANHRVYVPTSWLKAEGLTPAMIVETESRDVRSLHISAFRDRLLRLAMTIYRDARGAIEQLPIEARAPMRVAVESYVEIGRVLSQPGYRVKAGRATVPKQRRLFVALRALCRR